MFKKTLNCAVVGLGIGEQHAIAFLNDSRTRLTDIVDLDFKKAEQFVQMHKAQDIHIRNFKDIAEDPDNHLISLASFDDDHFEQVMICLKNNKHVFVEKPLCQTKAQLKEIYKLWRKRNVGLASNLILRRAPLYLYLKELIDTGKLGEIYAFDGDYLYGRAHKILEGWRSNIENYSVMEGGGIHLVDLMLMLTQQKPTEVHSYANKIATRDSRFKYNDFHSSVFHFPSGLIGRITANFGCVHRHQHVVRVFGTKGTFIYDDMGARLHTERQENSVAEHINLPPKPTNKGILIPEFIEQILNNEVNSSSKKEFELMSVVLAADESLQYRQPTKIEYLI